MKNRVYLFFGLILLLNLGLATSIRASETPRWKDAQVVEDSIYKKIHQIVTAYDSRAVIFVNAQIKQSELSLPSTPFVYRGLSVSNEEQTIELQKLVAKIYTEKGALPEPILAMLKMALKPYSVEPQIEVLALPEEMSLAKSLDSLDKSGVLSNPWLHNRWIQFLLAGLFLAFCLIPAASAFFNRRNNTRLIQHLESVIQRTMENFAENSGSSMGAFDKSTGAATAHQMFGANGSGSAQQIALSLEGFKALLMDCYWNGLDRYAAYVWQNAPVEMRGALLGSTAALVDYVRFFSGLAPVNLGYDDDPAYLRPLPINHLNQSSISQWAQGNTKHIKNLSRIRFEHLDFPAKDKIRLLNALDASDLGASTFDFSPFEKMASSPLRQLQVQLTITIKDVAEEKELVASVKGLSAHVKSRVVSLAWLLEIPKERAQSILQGFTAKDLASAWVGPEEVLNQLETYLPERKLRLLKDYLRTSAPNRKSPVFQAIHAQVVPHLTGPNPTITPRVAA